MNTPTEYAATIERGPGRPAGSAIDQRERLLDTAIRRFAGHGIAATSLRSLAQEAELTPAMLNYYFGSKSKLVEAVVAERLFPVIAELQEQLVTDTEADCIVLIRRFVTAMHEAIRLHPWLPALWVREVLADGGQLRAVFVEKIAPVLPRPLVRHFIESHAAGKLNPQLEPRLLLVTLMGMIMVPFQAAPIWRQIAASDDIDADAMREHTLAVLLHGVGA